DVAGPVLRGTPPSPQAAGVVVLDSRGPDGNPPVANPKRVLARFVALVESLDEVHPKGNPRGQSPRREGPTPRRSAAQVPIGVVQAGHPPIEREGPAIRFERSAQL